jgi:hypothetical protein
MAFWSDTVALHDTLGHRSLKTAHHGSALNSAIACSHIADVTEPTEFDPREYLLRRQQ